MLLLSQIRQYNICLPRPPSPLGSSRVHIRCPALAGPRPCAPMPLP
uniref:Uncharacterized protein n=1 Tax=Setaria italica TaxID=4555 RepID=K3ZGG3_SETIT